ncbi:cyclin-dependent kinase 2-associated protein 2 [Agrilus planipennis]|uniref:Cyclin-dependent kinase 2-associated protein 2 n=1 Tax=Agrilus planipennis TaxID=224129 RepID=A0A1W4WX05_AGRPL|nr:cyclin-dependent kinase 2-associated protein 2 [Agrilus planipennis]
MVHWMHKCPIKKQVAPSSGLNTTFKMDTVDIKAVESKLNDVTVTPVPMPANFSPNPKSNPQPAVVTASSQQPSQSKYAQLLGVIEELGREVRPTYAGSKSSAERLKRGIVQARLLVRECLIETERSARQ